MPQKATAGRNVHGARSHRRPPQRGFVVAASPTRLPLDAPRRRTAAASTEFIDAATMTDGAPILTDDFAPVDQLIGSTPRDDG
jgi:hypothetical protein